MPKPKLTSITTSPYVTEVVPVADLSPSVYRYLKRFNLRDGGLMEKHVSQCRQAVKKDPSFRDKALTCIARDSTGTIVGWSLVFCDTLLKASLAPNAGLKQIALNQHKAVNLRWTGYFYVRKTHRGYGVGTLLYDRTRLTRRKFYTHKWSSQSTSFFRKNERRTKHGRVLRVRQS